ncbi:MAG: hypothetical protein ACQCN3_02685 [Candidatus Bathyarchaeia archaeon]
MPNPSKLVVLAPGVDLTKTFCQYCGEPTLTETETAIVCTNPDCRMGKLKRGRR